MNKPANRPLSAWVVSLAILALALTVLPLRAHAAAGGPWPQTRSGWYVGLGVGAGSAGVSVDDVSSDRETGAAGSFRVGYVFTPKFGAGIGSNGWTKSEFGTTVSFNTVTAAASFYPAEGFVLRGGVGLGSLKASESGDGVTVSATKSGFGLTAGAAYEFRIMRTFAIGPQIDYSYVSTDVFKANYVNVGALLTWYFIPKK